MFYIIVQTQYNTLTATDQFTSVSESKANGTTYYNKPMTYEWP